MRFFCMGVPLLAVALIIIAKKAEAGNGPKVEWVQGYSVRGVLNIPYAELEEPFTALFDGTSGKSRIDYYGNMDMTYQRADMGKYGAMFKVVPITTETVVNKKTCLMVNGTSDSPVTVQSILPDMEGFELVKNKDTKNGLKCEKWQKVTTIEQKINRYTMWLTRKPSSHKTGVSLAVPVHYEMKGYNTLLGSHYDHYYLTYQDFNPQIPPANAFNVPPALECQGFPGPGAEHVYTMNPMKEFVHSYTDHVDKTFEDFTDRHSKEYNDDKDKETRKNIYRQNMRFIHSHNRKNLSYKLASNHLTDLTDQEMSRVRGRLYTPGYNGGRPFTYSYAEHHNSPDTLDWRLFGAVSQVKDQASCGSCWSFGTVGTLEGTLFLKTGQMTRLSQQALVDCSWGFGNNGCDGGEDFRSYQWIMKHGGIPTEDSYGKYLGSDGYCHMDDPDVVIGLKIKGYVNVTSGDLDALKVAIAKNGPISVGIDASHKTLSFYSSGVYYEPECGNKLEDLDHAVLAVGYGELNGQKYWLVKNSWSTYWGNDGYILMSQKDNNCGVATAATFVIPE